MNFRSSFKKNLKTAVPLAVLLAIFPRLSQAVPPENAGEALGLARTFTIWHQNFPEQFFRLAADTGIADGALLESANFIPKWVPAQTLSNPELFRFERRDIGVKQTTASITYELKNDSVELAVCLTKEGRVVVNWEARSGGAADYLLGQGRPQLIYWRYFGIQKIKKIARAIALLTGGGAAGETKSENSFHLRDVRKWEVVSLKKGISHLKIEFPLPGNFPRFQENSYFARVIVCGAQAGRISKILPLAISGNNLSGEIPLHNKNAVIAKIFSIDGDGGSASLFNDKVPFGAALEDPSFTEEAVRSAVRKAQATKLLDIKNFPKVLVATMWGITDVIFAKILDHSISHTNNGRGIEGYFAKVPPPGQFANLEINLDQGAAIVQIAYTPSSRKNRGPEAIRPDLAKAVRLCEEAGAGAIEVNLCGLTTISRGGGAALMDRPELSRDIIAAVARAVQKKTPVLVKMRTGMDAGHKNAADIAEIAEKAGADAVIVLAQTADKLFDRPFDYETAGKVKSRVKIPVIVNGGIRSPEEAKAVLSATGADGVMIGRACFFDPTVIRRTAEYLASGRSSPPPSPRDMLETAKKHLTMAADYYDRDFDLDVYIMQFMHGYMPYISRGLPRDRQKRALKLLISLDSVDEMRALFNFLDETLRKPGADNNPAPAEPAAVPS